MLIELNRTSFDLIEGESELISGFNIEYHRRIFVLIFFIWVYKYYVYKGCFKINILWI